MSWLFSQALVEEYLGASSLDGEQSAPLNGKPTQQAYCAPDKMTDFSRLSRFGMTFKPLTESRGEELLTLFREDFHAKTSQLQETVTDLMENDQECGEKWHGLLARFDPRYAFVENSPMLVTRGLERVLADLTAMGYDSRWGVISAADIGANHRRERIWIVANSNSNKHFWSKPRSNGIQNQVEREFGEKNSSTWESSGTSNAVGRNSLCGHEEANHVGNTKSTRFSSCSEGQGKGKPWRASIGSSQWWKVEPPLDRVVDGMADRVDRLKSIGNGQVPLCAATAWRILSE
jgi:hypothetical protein